MSSPTQRANLEAQLRRKYMRMKTINNHENVKLSRTLDGLHKYTVTSLEHHLNDNKEMSDLWNRCSTTTGWFDGAVKPGRRDMRDIIQTELKAKMTPWSYSKTGTIEGWEKTPPVGRPIRRPKTALGTYSIKSPEEIVHLKRPQTVMGTRTESPSHTIPADMLDGDDTIRLRAKSAHVNINNFHSPRLDDRGIKANGRPITAGPLLGGAKANYLKQKYGKHKQTEARPVKSAVQSRRQESLVDDVFMDTFDGPQKHVTKVKITMKSTEEPWSSSPHHRSTSPHHRATSPTQTVQFKRMSSTMSLTKRMSTLAPSEARSEHASSKHYDGIDDEDEENKKKKSKTLPKWNMPKFYVRPQDRYKMDDMFLMRRFTLLQRQLNAEVPPEVIKGNDKLQINVMFSAMARKSKLQYLIDENSQKVKTGSKTGYGETGLNRKIHKFLTEIDEYIEKQKAEQSI